MLSLIVYAPGMNGIRSHNHWVCIFILIFFVRLCCLYLRGVWFFALFVFRWRICYHTEVQVRELYCGCQVLHSCLCNFSDVEYMLCQVWWNQWCCEIEMWFHRLNGMRELCAVMSRLQALHEMFATIYLLLYGLLIWQHIQDDRAWVIEMISMKKSMLRLI